MGAASTLSRARPFWTRRHDGPVSIGFDRDGYPSEMYEKSPQHFSLKSFPADRSTIDEPIETEGIGFKIAPRHTHTGQGMTRAQSRKEKQTPAGQQGQHTIVHRRQRWGIHELRNNFRSIPWAAPAVPGASGSSPWTASSATAGHGMRLAFDEVS